MRQDIVPYIRKLVTIMQGDKGYASSSNIAKVVGWHQSPPLDPALAAKGINRRDEILGHALKHGVIVKQEGSQRYVPGPNYTHFLEEGEQPAAIQIYNPGTRNYTSHGRPNVVPMADPKTLGEIHPEYPSHFGKLANTIQNLIDNNLPVTRANVVHRRHQWVVASSPYRVPLDPNAGYRSRMDEILDESQKRGMIQWNKRTNQYEPGPKWSDYAGKTARSRGGRYAKGAKVAQAEKHEALNGLGLEHDSGWNGEYTGTIQNEDVSRVRQQAGLPPMPHELCCGSQGFTQPERNAPRFAGNRTE